MKYRNNDVHIRASMPGGEQVIDGHFLVQSCSSTGGQDPDDRLHPGLIAPFGRDGRMRFVVGRKGSKGVASWFTYRILAAETTFNHDPDKLNFAMMGQLTLNIERLGTLVFENVVLAQGHTLNANNWWFGARGADRVKVPNGNWIELTGRHQGTGEEATLYFLRGHASGTNDIEFVRGFVNPGLAGGSQPSKPIDIPQPKPGPSPKAVIDSLTTENIKLGSKTVRVGRQLKTTKKAGVQIVSAAIADASPRKAVTKVANTTVAAKPVATRKVVTGKPAAGKAAKKATKRT